MRWDNLRLDVVGSDDRLTAPLFDQGAVVRTFDTPEFRGITFYEVQARSIINRVPKASRVPFRYTINPYRGCSHACAYCQVGETPVLMADGRTRQLADLRPGDEIYGTQWQGRYRRYVRTEVLAHWSTRKEAYRILLADDTQLIASGDHRFLSDRGWKHVTGSEQGRARRAHLTVNNRLLGPGRFAVPPDHDEEYRQGYICGMVRGDGMVRSAEYRRRNGQPWTSHQFRLALIDMEALRRTQEYLMKRAIPSTEYVFQEAVGARREIVAIRNQSRMHVDAIREICRWPREPSSSWRKGFLAGIFDAEGSFSTVVRIANTDPEIIDQTGRALDYLGFSFRIERTARSNGLTYIRLLGGLGEVLRFFHTVDPAITRKRSIEGLAVKRKGPTRVMAIEPLRLRIPMFDITTGTGDFISNGVISHNCFARNTHTYLDLDYGEDFDSKIVVKVNAPQMLRRELARPKWSGEHIAMGTNVDPYQRAEGRYGLMRGILEALRDFANPFSILTKGTLILRDLDLLKECAAVADVGTNVSVGAIDPELWRAVEPGTPSPRKRLDACRALNEAGIPCGVLMAPILPFISDSDEELERTVRAIADAGATHVHPIVLHLRTGAREWYFRWLRERHPELVPRYEELYGRGAYAPKDFQAGVADRVHALAGKLGVGKASSAGSARRIPAPPTETPPEQLVLG